MRLGIIERCDCHPMLDAIENGHLSFPANVFKGSQHQIEEMFFHGELDLAPVSTIAYASHYQDCLILPGLLLIANGRSPGNVLLSKEPVNLLQGKTICVPEGVGPLALLRVILDHYLELKVDYITGGPDLDTMLSRADAALVSGDEALRVQSLFPHLQVLDLDEAWSNFTSEPLVHTLWVARSGYASRCPDELSQVERSLEEYFAGLRQDLSPVYRRAILRFLAHAQICGQIPPKVTLKIWPEDGLI
ncbi:MAG: menaquinone biosynthetic enzyme MqnA/MqnD family protein [Bacillota bacterium]